jgi:hypothetical protein
MDQNNWRRETTSCCSGEILLVENSHNSGFVSALLDFAGFKVSAGWNFVRLMIYHSPQEKKIK